MANNISMNTVFPKVFSEKTSKAYKESANSYKKLFESKEFYNAIMNSLGNVIYRLMKNDEEFKYDKSDSEDERLMVAEDDEEYIKYAKDVERTLRYLESNLHDTDDPEEIAMGALKTACEFYDADWAGFFGG